MTWSPQGIVVVPIDFSEFSLKALDTALEVAGDPSQVHVVHVLGDLSPAEPGEIWRTVDHDSRRRHATQALKELLADPKLEKVSINVAFGDPGQGIAEYAEKAGAKLIVLPSHGRTGLKRLLIGSVAERVVRLAHCPVLVLRS